MRDVRRNGPGRIQIAGNSNATGQNINQLFHSKSICHRANVDLFSMHLSQLCHKEPLRGL